MFVNVGLDSERGGEPVCGGTEAECSGRRQARTGEEAHVQVGVAVEL